MSSEPVQTLVKGNLSPPFQQQLLDAQGNVVDLTGASFVFRMAIRDGVSAPIGGSTGCSAVGDPTLGNFQYQWQPGDTNIPSDPVLYYAEVDVTIGGKTATYPPEAPWPIMIRDEV